MAHFSLSILELVLLLFTAIVLGITIHFFIVARRSLRFSPPEMDKIRKDLTEWKQKYFNDIEIKERERIAVKKLLEDAEESNGMNLQKLQELEEENNILQIELEERKKNYPSTSGTNLLQQLQLTQSGLEEHNERIAELLNEIEMLKTSEEKNKELQTENEKLSAEVLELRTLLNQRSKELESLRQKDSLTSQMSLLLESANNEFAKLQSKIQKLEQELNSSGPRQMEMEDLKEGYQRLSKDFEEQASKLQGMTTENQQLRAQLFEAEDKLKEANFERQLLQKKAAYFEELNSDLQALTESNKRLEMQLKRMAELESMLNVMAKERDELMRRQGDDE